MNEDLYFIPLLAKGSAEKNPLEGLKKAFGHIRRLGRKPQYEQGYAQFREWMREAVRLTRVEFVLESGPAVIGWLAVSPFEDRVMLRAIVPGEYRLKLSTGRTVWEERLSERNLLWTKAFPGRELELAADTEETDRPFSRRELLLDGSVALYVFPGVETGAIGVEILVTS